MFDDTKTYIITMESIINQDALRQYFRIIGELTGILADHQLSRIISYLEQIPDSTVDIEKAFEVRHEAISKPQRWLDALRFVRFVIARKNRLSDQYDEFVRAYQDLSAISERDADQEKLLKEVGDLMYNIDDLSGIYERLVEKLLQTLSISIRDVHGMLNEPDEEVYRAPIRDDQQVRIGPVFRELSELAARFHEQIQIMEALLRMRRLLIGY